MPVSSRRTSHPEHQSNAQAEALSSDSEEESEGAELRAAATAYKATAKRCEFPQVPQWRTMQRGCLQMTSAGCV